MGYSFLKSNLIPSLINRIRGYIDRGKIFRQFRLLIWTSFNGQFVHKVGGKGME